MSKNLAILGKYSARMSAGDYAAVYEVFAPDFFSHVTPRVSPEAVGTDIRPQEQKFWETARNAFSDMQFTVDLLIESGDLVVSTHAEQTPVLHYYLPGRLQFATPTAGSTRSKSRSWCTRNDGSAQSCRSS